MREPRPSQRLPEGDLAIYEKRKAGEFKGDMIIAYPADWKNPREPTPTREKIISWGYTVIVEPHFDPMMYFWPVDGIQFQSIVADVDSDHTKRLVRAVLRDGATIVSVSNISKLSTHCKFFDQASTYKKHTGEYNIEIGERELLRRLVR